MDVNPLVWLLAVVAVVLIVLLVVGVIWVFARHITLVAGVVTTVPLDRNYNSVEVINRDGAAEVYYTRNGATPTVGGNDTDVLPAAMNGKEFGPDDLTADSIKLISAGTPKISVVAS